MGNKKKAAEHGLSKKERKALEEKAAALRAELKAREKAAAKKAAKKGKKSKAEKPSKKAKRSEREEGAGMMILPDGEVVEAPALTVTPAASEAKAARKAKREAARQTGDEAAERAKPLEGDALKAAMDADVEAGKARAAEIEAENAEIRARLDKKRAERDGTEPGSPERLADLQASVAAGKAERKAKASKSSHPDKGGLVAAAEAHAAAVVVEAVEAIGQAIEIVETEHGREFVAGESVAVEDFAKPSEAPRELEEGRNGYKIIQLDAAGKPDPRKVRQMTRVTTFVGNIDDETTLKRWEKRKVVEGLALDATSPESVGLVPKINELAHRRDVAIAKAIKADRKGKLGIGEVASLIAAAEKEAKDAIDAIVEEAAELAGRNAKARGGTHLHSLAEVSDEKGIDEVRRMHEDGDTVTLIETGEEVPITETDRASIEAYDERMRRLGAKVIESEAVVVNDAMGYAGRLDRILMARLPALTFNAGKPDEWTRPADVRARRYVADIKSGRIDLGAGKIARQLAAYALGDLYDLETGERTSHRAARDVALVFHLPQGEGVCRVHAVDLKAGAVLLKLSGEVRRARNTGKRTIDVTVDITDPAPAVAGDDEAAK